MSEIIEHDSQSVVERELRTGRFVKGGLPGPGRPKGSRNKLGEQFLDDLSAYWRENGPQVIAESAKNDPAALLKVIASLLPRDVHLTVGMADMADREDVYRDMISTAGSHAALLAQLDTIRADIEAMAADEAKVIEDPAS